MELPAVLTRLLDRPAVVTIRSVLDVYGRAPGTLLANGLAFTALFSIVPIALVTLGVAGLLVKDPAVQQQLAAALGSIVPPLSDLIQEALVAMSQGAAVSSIVGIGGLIWTVSQFYVTLDVAFSRIFTGEPERDVLRRTARGFIWVVGLIGTVVALIVAGSLAAAAEALLPTTSTALTAFGRVVSSPPIVVLITIGVVLIVYRVLPPQAPSLRAAVPPAIGAGLAIFLLAQLFLFAAERIVGIAALTGPLATAFIALAWLSFSFQALLYGAAWVSVRDGAMPKSG
ncbi:MAG TPA: YihY/virulence factor BrkB family protein [Candidatus Limnocylindrales bacterium]